MAEPSLRLADIHVMQQTPDTQVIGWKLLNVGNADLSDFTLSITRSYAPNDGFDSVSPSPPLDLSNNFAVIEDSSFHDHWRIPYYKITVTDTQGRTKVYGPLRIGGELDGVGLSLIKNVRTLLRLGGNPILIYQKIMDESARCSCWDTVLKKVTLSNCTNCYNTGFTGGYYDPLLTLCLITPEAKISEPGDTLRQNTATDALMLNYPILRPRDIIYEVNTGRRFRVGSIQTYEKNRALIHQQFPLIRLNPGDIEHQLPVPDPNSLTPLIERRRSNNRQLLQNNVGQSPVVIKDLGV